MFEALAAASRFLLTPHPSFLTRILMIPFCCSLLTACAGPAYYWQAIRGHLHLMHERRDVSDVLDDADTDPALRARLVLAGEILEFAERELNLPAGDSYRTLVQVDGPVTWNVIATPEFSLRPRRWCFPVAGCVAYRGYFKREQAVAFAGKLQRRNLDVAVLPAAAYSTLGWFEDPLLDTMLELEPSRLAGMLFHELAHRKLYVRDDTLFNEAYASFVETAGVERWLSRQAGKGRQLEAWRRWAAAGESFSALVRETRAELASLYASVAESGGMRRSKHAVFTRFRERYRTLVEDAWNGRGYFNEWMSGDLNNAHLAAFGAYTGGRCAFLDLMRQADGDFSRFHELAGEFGRADETTRRNWLDEPCQAVASGNEL